MQQLVVLRDDLLNTLNVRRRRIGDGSERLQETGERFFQRADISRALRRRFRKNFEEPRRLPHRALQRARYFDEFAISPDDGIILLRRLEERVELRDGRFQLPVDSVERAFRRLDLSDERRKLVGEILRTFRRRVKTRPQSGERATQLREGSADAAEDADKYKSK